MRKVFDIFRISREERLPALVMLVILLTMNGLLVAHYYGVFTPLSDDYWSLFIRKFVVSGFDPITYYVVSSWEARYQVYRHPLLAFYMYVPYLLNRGLMWLTGINCAIFIVAAMQVLWSFYSFVFARRIMREVIGLRSVESTLLAFMLFGFAYVMLSAIVPDHFMLSMMLLLISLYISGIRIDKGRNFKVWQSVLYFLLTAGTSLNNGLKIFLCGLFVNGKRFFRPRYLLLAVILPAVLLWVFARLEYHYLVLPGEQQRHQAKVQRMKEQRQKEAEKKKKEEEQRKTAQMQAPVKTASNATTTPVADAKSPADTTKKPATPPKKAKRQIQGKPLAQGEFMRWTDITTSRREAIVENLFGESIQLHRDHLLQDIMRRRPVFVHYTDWWNYAVEAVVVLLFLAGIWMGRRSRFLWLAMSFFGLDMLLHVVLGFGINEVYIMSAHWIYVIPIAMGFLLRGLKGRWRTGMSIAMSLLTVYLLIYNVLLIVQYLL
ncbi:MAG: GtrA family protein [Prevotella sp.]|nr:GtrA family protein [Prevotella sp.]